MGQFTELSLSFYFHEDTPSDVLSTFAPLRRPDQDSSFAGSAPNLTSFDPAPNDDWWEPDWGAADGADPLAHEPWRHDWARWLSGSMSVSTVPTAALVWSELKLWHFSCRCSLKVWPDVVLESLGWLGSFIHTSDNEAYPRPDLVGVMTYDGSLRPYLLFCQYGRLSIQNLNGPGEEF